MVFFARFLAVVVFEYEILVEFFGRVQEFNVFFLSICKSI
jgi:hypothetical protein